MKIDPFLYDAKFYTYYVIYRFHWPKKDLHDLLQWRDQNVEIIQVLVKYLENPDQSHQPLELLDDNGEQVQIDKNAREKRIETVGLQIYRRVGIESIMLNTT